jgi:hypothetical protein
MEVDLRRLLRKAAKGADRHGFLAALLAVAVLAGCGSSHVGRDDVAELPDGLYYAGLSFAGLPLTHADAGGLFVYGDCTPKADAGCAPPVEIQHFSFRRGDWALAVGCHLLPSLRGVPTVRHDGLVLVTRGTFVKIYARNTAEDRRVALALRPIRGPNPERLSPPRLAVARAVNEACR